MMIYELEDGFLKQLPLNNSIQTVSLKSIYQRNINDRFTLLINSFKNKVLVVENEYIEDNRLKIDSSLGEWLETPSSNLDHFSSDLLCDESILLKSKKEIQISLAITYSCNLRCSYCFQQQYDGLIRKPITLSDLEKILENISLLSHENPDLKISLELFGGEPLMPQNEFIIDRIFKYCVENRIKVSITTNGIFLPYFAKKLIIHRKIISAIVITINTLPENYGKVVRITKVANNVEKLLKVTELLLDYGLVMDVGTNFDKTNLHDLVPIFEYFSDKGYFDRKNFYWNIGRVDDRLYDNGYDDYIVSETDILLELIKIRDKIPQNLHAGFI